MVLTSLTALKALWSPSAESARLVAAANPACRQYQPANTDSDLLDSSHPPSLAYHASSPQPLANPFFDDEDDMPDSAIVRPIPMQSAESHHPVVLRRSFAKYRGFGSTRVWW